uniref:Chitin-binding type-2 domain-containing protein n=1 Tax=Trichogramma kaykai TaxID=54128 RepID=A0ABD2W0E6_9HYME
MRIVEILSFFIFLGCTWQIISGTCVLNSDFGFSFSCALKKSGLFRIRNLGGVKGYFGLGLSVGDELGFADSLTNLDSGSSSRRSAPDSARRAGHATYYTMMNPFLARQAGRSPALPPFKPLPNGGSRPMAQQPERQRLVVQNNNSSSNSQANALRTMPSPTFAELQEDVLKQQQRVQQEAKLKQQQPNQQEILAAYMLKQQRTQQLEAMKQQQHNQPKVQFNPQALQAAIMQTRRINQGANQPARLPNIVAAIPPVKSMASLDKMGNAVPAFVSMPSSAARITNRISDSPTLDDSTNELTNDDDMQKQVNKMTLMSLHPIVASESANQPLRDQEKRQSMPSLPSLAPIQSMEPSLKALAEASNITLEALEAAISLRQQQLLQKQQGPPATTTTTTLAPVKSKPSNTGATKVMNAPREYYPVGYDKNFDDNFASRVDLPDTTFYCGDQKHFPGLYADEDLGCMVFHVCALTDEGLIMKSFLCPESTLFDQTILKCNWWFYVDCKASKSLYDSNIPISKSYQLMKALAFFSAYKSHDNSTQQLINNEDDTK